jgi:hypothetical protein
VPVGHHEQELDLGQCEVCQAEPAVGVAAIPGVPMSIAWGRTCLQRGVLMPLWTAQATVGMCVPPQEPDWKHLAEWFREGTTYVDGEYVRIDSFPLVVVACPQCKGSADGCPGCFQGQVVELATA